MINVKNSVRILRQPEVLDRIGLGRSTLYNRIDASLFPPPIRLGPNSVGWPNHEVDLFLKYLIAGSPDDELRLVVQKLVKAREMAT